METPPIDLLYPGDHYMKNYIHQIRRTIETYRPTLIAVGEAIQNAMDAVCDAEVEKGFVDVVIDFDHDTVTLTDNGIGFPRNLSLLYLGGSTKSDKKRDRMGLVGVGIKVTLFSSNMFQIRSLSEEHGAWKVEIPDADQFENVREIKVQIEDDPQPRDTYGTEIQYVFRHDDRDTINKLDEFVEEMFMTCSPRGVHTDFVKTVREQPTGLPSPFAALLSSYLRRFTYVGNVRRIWGDRAGFPPKGMDIQITVICSDPQQRFPEYADLFGNTTQQTFRVEPEYLHIEETARWIPKGKKLEVAGIRFGTPIYDAKLGWGGQMLLQTDGFNRSIYVPGEYAELLKDRKGKLPDDIDKYERSLFPRINGIVIFIGRITPFNVLLPGGSRRIISCNGVITSHEISIYRGRRQQAARCLDIVIDVDAELNYGKSHITDNHLVKLLRDFLNEAYNRTLEKAADKWVGEIRDIEDEEFIPEIFVQRPRLGLADYMTRTIPQCENDVIALFFELAGRGYFPQYYVFGLSQKDTYDCRAAIQREADSSEVLNPRDDTQLRIVEFKLHARDVIPDFERGQKEANKIELVVAWDEGDATNSRYPVYDIDQSKAYDASPRRVFPLVSKYIHALDERREIQIILLCTIIDEIKGIIGTN